MVPRKWYSLIKKESELGSVTFGIIYYTYGMMVVERSQGMLPSTEDFPLGLEEQVEVVCLDYKVKGE